MDETAKAKVPWPFSSTTFGHTVARDLEMILKESAPIKSERQSQVHLMMLFPRANVLWGQKKGVTQHKLMSSHSYASVEKCPCGNCQLARHAKLRWTDS